MHARRGMIGRWARHWQRLAVASCSVLLVGAAMPALFAYATRPPEHALPRTEPPREMEAEGNPLGAALRCDQEGRLSEAAAWYERAAIKRPAHALALRQRAAWRHLYAGRYADAERLFELSSPVAASPAVGRALVRYLAGDLAGALGLLEGWTATEEWERVRDRLTRGARAPAGSVDRDWAVAYFYGQVVEPGALPLLERVAAAWPQHAGAHWELALEYERLGRLEEAERTRVAFRARNLPLDSPESVALAATGAPPEEGLSLLLTALRSSHRSGPPLLYVVAASLIDPLPEGEAKQWSAQFVEEARAAGHRSGLLILEGRAALMEDRPPDFPSADGAPVE